MILVPLFPWIIPANAIDCTGRSEKYFVNMAIKWLRIYASIRGLFKIKLRQPDTWEHNEHAEHWSEWNEFSVHDEICDECQDGSDIDDER